MSTSLRLPTIGYVPPESECRVPAGCVVVELKSCENCMRLFTRRPAAARLVVVKNDEFWDQREFRGVDVIVTKTLFKDQGQRFCATCRSHLLLPEFLDEDLKDQFSSMFGGRRKQFLPHYDESLVKRKKHV
jgi:hypothetical protein